MKSVIAFLFVCLLASSAAFAPTMMAVKPKAAPKKAAAGLASKTKQAKGQFFYDDGLTDLIFNLLQQSLDLRPLLLLRFHLVLLLQLTLPISQLLHLTLVILFQLPLLFC